LPLFISAIETHPLNPASYGYVKAFLNQDFEFKFDSEYLKSLSEFSSSIDSHNISFTKDAISVKNSR
jgi:hypothetical protein